MHLEDRRAMRNESLRQRQAVIAVFTVTYRLPDGGVGAATDVGAAFFSEANWTVPLEDKMVGQYTLTVTEPSASQSVESSLALRVTM